MAVCDVWEVITTQHQLHVLLLCNWSRRGGWRRRFEREGGGERERMVRGKEWQRKERVREGGREGGRAARMKLERDRCMNLTCTLKLISANIIQTQEL